MYKYTKYKNVLKTTIYELKVGLGGDLFSPPPPATVKISFPGEKI